MISVVAKWLRARYEQALHCLLQPAYLCRSMTSITLELMVTWKGTSLG